MPEDVNTMELLSAMIVDYAVEGCSRQFSGRVVGRFHSISICCCILLGASPKKYVFAKLGQENMV